jgi:2-oxoglutarate dehydrogenase E1 component
MTVTNSLSAGYMEQLLEDYLRGSADLPDDWRRYFGGLVDSGARRTTRRGPTFSPPSLFRAAPSGATPSSGQAGDGLKARLELLAIAYRTRGHLAARIDPLERPRVSPVELAPAYHGFSEGELDRPLVADPGGGNGRGVTSVRERIRELENTYCHCIGVEFMHIDDLAIRCWLQERMEATQNRTALTPDDELRILTRLTEAMAFERFVLKRYVGAKVFSLEGAEVLIALLDRAIETAAVQGVQQIVMGMAHRGRLNVLANILGKSPSHIFRELNEELQTEDEGGDVRYHLGHSNDWVTAAGQRVHLTLCFNPSHLEFVTPVATGKLRGAQDRAGDVERKHGMALVIHGDAAFAAEGIVQETLNLSGLPAYQTGGTLHVVLNNQIGFTTPPEEGRSSGYATDVAKLLQVPIFHVNGDDPLAVAHVVDLALDFRHRFQRDSVIDLVCYRRRGHNENDEPEFTQPVLYRHIRRRPPVCGRYLNALVARGVATQGQADAISQRCDQRLEEEYEKAQSGASLGPSFQLDHVWQGYREGLEPADEQVDTGVDRETLAGLLQRLSELPQDFHLHSRLKRWIKRRREMARGERPLDWSAAEALALATLAADGYRIRVSGQDAARGTFSQRHAVLHDAEDGHTYVPLTHVAPDQAPVDIINSPLSEAGVLGFEYGYSLSYPDCLVAWEAQFGDFVNAAQVIVDQFLASAEKKWRRLSGIVLLLPHGYEGQGPEHSSARLERFLRLSNQHNMQVVVPTVPAQYFHCLRRQMLRRWLKPLVVLTPKGFLRHPRAVCSLDELAAGTFHRVLPDREVAAERVKRILVCCGKIYFELVEQRERRGRDDAAILRLEQLYPFPAKELDEALLPYPDRTPVCWVQEEPENMGAHHYVRYGFLRRYADRFPFAHVARPRAAVPATGSISIHKREQRALFDRAFARDGASGATGENREQIAR